MKGSAVKHFFMKINKRGIYYISRKYIEPNSIGNEENKRPVLVIKKYNSNVIFIPITKNNNDPSHLEIEQISQSYEHSYVKLSVIQTLSTKKFSLLASYRDKKVSTECFSTIMDNLIKFL